MLKIYLLPLLFLFACVSKTYQNQDKHVCGGKSSLDKKIYKPRDKLYTDVPHLIYLPGGMFPNDKPADSPHLYNSHYGSISLGPLFVSQHEITNSQYAYFLNAMNETSSSEEQGKVLMKKYVDFKNSHFKIQYSNNKFSCVEDFENYPIVCVNYYGAKKYCEWLTEYQKQHNVDSYQYPIRLPSHLESRRLKEDYKDLDSVQFDKISWHKENSNNKVHEVGLKSKGINGLYDVNGNVEEWCYNDYPIEKYTEGINRLFDSDSAVVKGGSYKSDKLEINKHFISGFPKKSSSVFLGFRVVQNSCEGMTNF